MAHRESVCERCGRELGSKAWITLDPEQGAPCLACGDLDHLMFLPLGDAPLTRRAKKHSRLAALVLKWSRDKRRYKRQGMLVEKEALARAEEECFNEAEARERRHDRLKKLPSRSTWFFGPTRATEAPSSLRRMRIAFSFWRMDSIGVASSTPH